MFKRSSISHSSRIAKIKAMIRSGRNKSFEQSSSETHVSKITIHYDVGMPNSLYIRGQGAGLSWDKGQLMKNMGPSEWVWETNVPFEECEFKVLINDEKYEIGDNRRLYEGAAIRYTPVFF